MICKNCNCSNADNATYCVGCGAPLEPSNTYSDSYQQVQQNYQQPYQNYQPQGYQQPYQGSAGFNGYSNEDEHVSVMGWIGRFCITLIPCVGPFIFLIMLFVWAFGSTPKKSLKSFARAYLIIILFGVVISIIIVAIFYCMGYSINDLSSSYTYHYYY